MDTRCQLVDWMMPYCSGRSVVWLGPGLRPNLHHKFNPVTHLCPSISFPLHKHANGWLGRIPPCFLLRRARPLPRPPSNIFHFFHHRRHSFRFHLSRRTVRVAPLHIPPRGKWLRNSYTTCLHSSLTFALSRHWIPLRAVRQSRARSALWRAALYSLATLLRLCAPRPP